ncbi:MAG: hypothetical protein IKZ82_03815 [Clostridia bacterium]|nr:hypothetical protein [Clostridia bacterium]
MLERSVRIKQRKIKAAGEDILAVQKAIGELLARSIEPGDHGLIFRCRLLLNRCHAIDEELTRLYAELPENGSTAVSRSLCLQNKQLVELQRSTLTSLLDSMKRSEDALDEAKQMELLAESIRLGERIKKNVR